MELIKETLGIEIFAYSKSIGNIDFNSVDLKKIQRDRYSNEIRCPDKEYSDKGAKIAGGSDCPIEEGNPLFEFYAAITRQNHSGSPIGGWQPQEKVSNLQALKMFTTWAAYGAFQENYRGKIAVGYDADFTVLSDNPLNINPTDILNLKITHTIVNGKIVYSKL